MEICKTILVAIRQALECEELRLKPRSALQRRPWTVSGVYTEAWVCYLLVKELAERCPDEWEFDREVSRVDLLICDHATVELKGPHLVEENLDRCVYKHIIEDFKKQRRRAKIEPTLEHFVLMILHAPKSDFDSGFFHGWLDQLELKVREKNPAIRIESQQSDPLVLNGNKGLMQCCLYRIF